MADTSADGDSDTSTDADPVPDDDTDTDTKRSQVWWGSASDHMISKYLPKVSNRLEAEGWYHIEDADYWCRTAEVHDQMLTVVWRKGSAEAAEPSDLDSVREWKGVLETNQQPLVDNDIADPEEIRSTRSNLQTHERRIERRR